MRLSPYLVLLLVPALSAACCCGPPPTLPGTAVFGEWALEGSLPTGSALGDLDSVRVTFVSGVIPGGHLFAARTAAGEPVDATVRLHSADPDSLVFTIEHAPATGAPAFAVRAEGWLLSVSDMRAHFHGENGAPLGMGLLRKR